MVMSLMISNPQKILYRTHYKVILWYLPELRHRLLPLLCVFRVPKKILCNITKIPFKSKKDRWCWCDHRSCETAFWWGWLDHQTWQSFFHENHMQQIYLRTYVPVFFRTYWSLSLKLVDLVYLFGRIRLRIMWQDQNENIYWHQLRLE